MRQRQDRNFSAFDIPPDTLQIVHLFLKSRTFTYTIREKHFKEVFYVQYFPDNFEYGQNLQMSVGNISQSIFPKCWVNIKQTFFIPKWHNIKGFSLLSRDCGFKSWQCHSFFQTGVRKWTGHAVWVGSMVYFCSPVDQIDTSQFWVFISSSMQNRATAVQKDAEVSFTWHEDSMYLLYTSWLVVVVQLRSEIHIYHC